MGERDFDPTIWFAQGDQDTLSDLISRFSARLEAGDLVLLDGAMGAGKTTLTRAIARGIRVHRPERVCSPTYQVAMEHEGPIPLMHVDLFRMADLGHGELRGPALEALGLEEDTRIGQEGVWVVEWGRYWLEAPVDRYEIYLRWEPGCTESRQLRIRGLGTRCAACLEEWATQEIAVQQQHERWDLDT